MRKMNLGRVMMLALPLVALTGAGCGGIEDLFGDGGTKDMVSGGADMSGCGDGVTLFALGSGTYTIQDVTLANAADDGCNLQPAGLKGLTREGIYDSAKGTLTLKGSAGRPDFGSGTIRCNIGLLTLPATADTAGACAYTLQRESQVTVTAASTFTVKFTETQTMKGAMCNPKTDCTSKFTMIWKR